MSKYLYIAAYRDRFEHNVPSHKKIGITNNPPARMKSPSDTKGTIEVVLLELWGRNDEASMQAIESRLHAKLAQRRLDGEWFRDDDGDLVELIAELLLAEPGIDRIGSEGIPLARPRSAGKRRRPSEVHMEVLQQLKTLGATGAQHAVAADRVIEALDGRGYNVGHALWTLREKRSLTARAKIVGVRKATSITAAGLALLAAAGKPKIGIAKAD